MSAEFASLNPRQLRVHLEKKSPLSSSLLAQFEANQLTGAAFLQLTREKCRKLGLEEDSVEKIQQIITAYEDEDYEGDEEPPMTAAMIEKDAETLRSRSEFREEENKPGSSSSAFFTSPPQTPGPFLSSSPAPETFSASLAPAPSSPSPLTSSREAAPRSLRELGEGAISRLGSEGGEDSQFRFPWGVASNSRSEIIVADAENHRIQVFDREGRFLFKVAATRASKRVKGERLSPFSVAVDPRNNQIITAGNDLVQIFDERGNFLREFGPDKASTGLQYFSLRGVAVEPKTGNYYVTDCYNYLIFVFNSEGKFLKKLGSSGKADGKLDGPFGIGILSDGNLVVSEIGGSRLQVFDPRGKFVMKMVSGDHLKTPGHIAIDPVDNILVADQHHGEVLVFDRKGKFLKAFGKGKIFEPSGVCMDAQGRVIVTEVRKNRFTVF